MKKKKQDEKEKKTRTDTNRNENTKMNPYSKRARQPLMTTRATRSLRTTKPDKKKAIVPAKSVSKGVIKQYLQNYLEQCKIIEGINCSKRRVRRPNFPEVISEHIVYYYLVKNEPGDFAWDIQSGDLTRELDGNVLKIEVKCTSSDGPLSFGPTQHWDELFFVDASRFEKSSFTIYKVNCNKEHFHGLKVNNEQTIGEQSDQMRRPRISFVKLRRQLGSLCKCVFRGHIDELL